MNEQQLAHRLWLMEWRRWVRWVEIVHQERMMRGEWRWLYSPTGNK